MMIGRLCLAQSMHENIWEHLLKDQREQVAFIFADAQRQNLSLTLKATDVYLVPHEELDFHSSYHVSLTDEALAKIIKMAWDRRAALVELHSHPHAIEASFSPSDLMALPDLVHHVRWRLKGQPYVAIVAAPNGFDALGWWNGDGPENLDAIEVGATVLRPTRVTLERIREGK